MPTTIPISIPMAISTEERQARTRPPRAASLVTLTPEVDSSFMIPCSIFNIHFLFSAVVRIPRALTEHVGNIEYRARNFE